MSLPSRIRQEDLQKFGFIDLGGGVVKHEKHKTFRYECADCGDYVKRLPIGRRCDLLLSPIESAGAGRGELRTKVTAHMRAV